MKHIKSTIILLAASFVLVLANLTLVPQVLAAPNVNPSGSSSSSPSSSGGAFSSAKGSACNGISEIDSSQGCQTKGSAIHNLFVTTVNVLSFVVGIVAIIMLIISGIRFVTSAGNSNSVSAAKSTLIYAIVGLVIVALAQIIVRWVIGTSTKIAAPTGFIHFL